MSSLQTLERVTTQLSAKLGVIAARAAALIVEDAPTYVRSLQLDGQDLESVVTATCALLAGSLKQPDLLRHHSAEIEGNAHHRSVSGVSLETMMSVLAIQRRCVIQAFEEMVGPGGARTVLIAERRLDRSYATLVAGVAAGYLGGMTERWKEQQSALEALVVISRAINRSLDVADVAQAGLSETVRAMDLSAGALWLTAGPDTPLTIGHSVGFDAAEEELLRSGDAGWFIEKAALSPGPIQTGLQPELELRISGIRSAAAVALRSNGEVLGVLALASRVPRRLKQTELTFLVAVGDQVAVALARAFQHRLEARTDYLTGLANRPEFDRALERAIAVAERYQRPLALVVLDLDELKSINDDHGHHSGDTAIRAVAEVLLKMVRASDTCARLGGDEFGVALPEISEAQALELVERIRRELWRASTGLPYRLEISVGVASWDPAAGAVGLMELADTRLYQDKRRHRAARRDRKPERQSETRP